MSNTIAHRTFSLPTSDQHSLFAQEWKPSCSIHRDALKPTIGIVHGLGEHSGRYTPVAEFFAQHGYHVVSYDHRGHGKTGGHMPPFHILQNDIQCICDYARRNYQSPIILYGQSLGGALVLKYLAHQTTNEVTAAIASSPLFTPTHHPPRWKVFFGELLLPWLPKLQLAHGLKAQALTHDTNIVEQFRRDPLVRRKVSIALGYSMLESGKELLATPTSYSMPILLMHGSADQITSAEATKLFATKLDENCELKIWHDRFHELHFETNAPEVLEFVRSFIESH
jgi:alpha-beta hydrolase superfamily lysophospholipase